MKKLLLLFCFALIMGQAFSQKWDKTFQGTTYQGSPVGAQDMVEYNGDFYVAGTWNAALQTYIAKWDGTAWTAVGTGFIELGPTSNWGSAKIYALEVFNGELYAGGYFDIDIGGTTYGGLVKWDGTSWSAITDWPSGAVVFDLDQFNGNIMIGGKFSGLFGGATAIDNIIGHNGTNWVPFNQGVWQGEVFSMDEHNGEFYIAGKFYQDRATNAFLDNIAKWDGSNSVWVNIGVFATLYTNNGYIDQIQSYGSHLYVYTLRNDIFSPVPRLLRWDISTEVTEITVVSSVPWSSLARLDDMSVYDGNLIVSGYYQNSQAGGNASSIQIESYDGTAWNKALVGGASASALGVYNNKLTNGTLSYQDPSVEFTADKTTPCLGEAVTFSFTEVSANPITSFTWTFEGGTPATSTDAAPVVTWAANGNYKVSIDVTSTDGTNTVKRSNYIRIDNTINITAQPVDVTDCEGETANFFITRNNGSNFTQQWQWDDGTGFVDIDGATATSFSTPLTLDKNGYKIRCKVIRCGNEVLSSEATITVNETPEITNQPVTQNLCVSGDVTFTIETSFSSGSVTYQWQYYTGGANNYADLSDAGVYTGTNTNVLTLTGADITLPEIFNSGTFAMYRCVVSGNGCDVISGSPRLNIYSAATITEHPIDLATCDSGLGVSASFSVTASSGTGGYQWQVDDGTGFVNIVDDAIYGTSDTKTLSLTSAPANYNGYQFRCEVGICSPGVFSDAATLTIETSPVITAGPANTGICNGSDTEFTVEVTGGSNLVYQWQFSTGSTSNSAYTDILVNDNTYVAFDGTLQITGATAALNNYRYRCVISSGTTCSLTSGNGQLKVYDQPTLTSITPSNALTVCDGAATVLRVSPSNTTGISAGVFTYQWQLDAFDLGFVDIADDNNYSGSTTRNLSITVAPFSFNGNKYRCILRGCTTENASELETLTVLQLPLVTTSPQPQTVCTGEQVTFTALATGSDVTYTWWRDAGGGNYTQVRGVSANPDYTFVASRDFNGFKYKCIAQAGNCTATAESFEATLTVQETQLTAVSTQALEICAGETAMFGVEVSNLDGLTFQWSDVNGVLTDGDMYAGATTDTLTITAPTTAINNYSVAITGTCGNKSASFSLRVAGLGTPEIEGNLADPSNPQLFVTNTNIFQLGVDNFEWFLNGASYQSTGATASVTIDQEGSYTVVASKSGCDYPESNAIVIVITGFDKNLSASDISFYPNPVVNKLNLEMGNDFDLNKGANIIITNISGKEVYNQTFNALQSRKKTIDMSSYESGIYLVRVINGDKIAQYKIRKQ